MVGNLLKNLNNEEPSNLNEGDKRLAIAALLVRVARSDGDYAANEIKKIDSVLARRYLLDRNSTISLREKAELLEEQAPSTEVFTRGIKDSVSEKERIKILEALWMVSLADGERDIEEEKIINFISQLLGISKLDNNLAKLRITHS